MQRVLKKERTNEYDQNGFMVQQGYNYMHRNIATVISSFIGQPKFLKKRPIQKITALTFERANQKEHKNFWKHIKCY